MANFAGRSRLLLVLSVVVMAGCGTQTYKSRLNETAQYFEYKETLNRELGPPWSAAGIVFQPPKQFVSIAPPAPATETEGAEAVEEPDEAEDPRQPHYLGIELPGLLGAWEANVEATVADQTETRKAYLYVMSNQSRYLQKPDSEGMSADPATFLSELEDLLTTTIGVVLPPGETGNGTSKNERYRETLPVIATNAKFTPRKEYTAVTLSPQIDVGNLDLPFEMQLYEWSGQHIQVAVLMVYPQSVGPRENLQSRLMLAMETLDVSDTRPVASAQPGDAPGSGGGGGSGIAF